MDSASAESDGGRDHMSSSPRYWGRVSGYSEKEGQISHLFRTKRKHRYAASAVRYAVKGAAYESAMRSSTCKLRLSATIL